jgi:hypothetical protein
MLHLFCAVHKKTFIWEINVFTLHSYNSTLKMYKAIVICLAYAQSLHKWQCGSLYASPVTKITQHTKLFVNKFRKSFQVCHVVVKLPRRNTKLVKDTNKELLW